MFYLQSQYKVKLFLKPLLLYKLLVMVYFKLKLFKPILIQNLHHLKIYIIQKIMIHSLKQYHN